MSAWFRARPSAEAGLTLVKARDFEPQRAAITAIDPSTRERSFVTGATDGSLVLRHLTSERTLLRFPATGTAVLPPASLRGRTECSSWRVDGSIDRYSLRNPHPEFSWRAVLGRVWYEGYPEPSYVWQSTGATEEFESKLSLVPLVFGTIKATLYALVFAVPLAVMGRSVHLAVRPSEGEGQGQAGRRDHGRAAERRDRLRRGAVAGLAASRPRWCRCC